MASKEQKEGVARVLDTLAASSIIALAVAISGYTILNMRDIVISVCFVSGTSWLFLETEETLIMLSIFLICIGLAAGAFTWWVTAQDKKNLHNKSE